MNRRVEPQAAAGQRFVVARPPLRAVVDQHLYSALSSLGRLWQRRLASALTMLVMALALALPLLLHLAVRNLERFGGDLRDSRELTAFLDPARDAEGAQAAAVAARALPGAGAVEVRAPDAGLAELRELAGFGEALDLLSENPLPFTLVVAPAADATPESVHALARALDGADGVDFVQYDLAWRERLDATLALGARTVGVLAALLGLGALLVVGNTIRLDVAARADEIAVVQLLGGSDGFVRRPFLYAGCWYGLGAALAALAGVALARIALAGPVSRLAASYGSAYRLAGLDASVVLATLAAGLMLGWLGAWVACGRHLARGKPQ
jgi:cell division transport system permease protein